jgi:glycolate oxidase FAD binding subunit
MTSPDPIIGAITERIFAARAHHSTLQIRGGGSKSFYLPPSQTEVLDTRILSGIVSYEPSELVVTVLAGTPLSELEALLGGHGQCLPFEPPHYGWSSGTHATVGGMVASGLSGPARASTGGVRDYVLGVKLINGLGQHLTFGGQVMKNVAGYDVSRLMAGALGTLGVLTEVSLKVLPIAPAQTTLCFELGQAAALEQLHVWGAQPLPLNASCWVQDRGKDLLFVRLRGAVAAVEAACVRMLKDAPGTRIDDAQAVADWEQCRNHQLPFFAEPQHDDMALWRLSLPQTATVLDLPYAQLMEWHGALRWLWAPLHAQAAIEAEAHAAHGTAGVFVRPKAIAHATHGATHDAGHRTPRLVPQGPAAASAATVMKRLKASFDPQGIFNPNVH